MKANTCSPRKGQLMTLRTTITLDDDVAALIVAARRLPRAHALALVNRLLRRSARVAPPTNPPELPELPGRPILDVSDVSALLAALDDERRAQRGLP
jgi:hypothetical protein